MIEQQDTYKKQEDHITDQKLQEYKSKIDRYIETTNQYKQQEHALKAEIIQKPRPVEKLSNGNIRIPYDRKGEQRNFDINLTEKKIIVRHYTYIPTLGKKARKIIEEDHIDLSSYSQRNKELGKMLDKHIGTPRVAIPKKAQQARSLIKTTDKTNHKEQRKQKPSLQQKPIDLGYQAILPDETITFIESLPDRETPAGRILRCLRYKSITDMVEKRYSIPEGLLLAMMAQEGYGDPTIPNFLQDGGVGLIHIQAINAHHYGLKTLPRYTNDMTDKKHGALVNQYLKKYKSDLKKLQQYDERFHPILAIDVAARFLVATKKRLEHTIPPSEKNNERLYALKRYGPGNPPAPKGFQKHANKVMNFWQLLNKIGHIKNPTLRNNIKRREKNTINTSYNKKSNGFHQSEKIIKQYIEKSHIATIGNRKVNYQGYQEYFSKIHHYNYEGQKYHTLQPYQQ